MLDLIYFPPPHTGHEIGALVKKVFQEWDIKVPIIVTDNGSNMVKAFKQVRANHVEDVIESVVANTISTEINAEADAVQEDNLFSDSSDIEVDGEVDVSFHEDADIERPAQEEIPTYSISQVDTVEDATTLDISETTSEIEIENEEVELLRFERQASEYMRTIFPRRNGETEEAYLNPLLPDGTFLAQY